MHNRIMTLREVMDAEHPQGVPFASASLLAAVNEEIAALDKEIELMQLRVSECTDRATEQTLRTFGSCLWIHKLALERAIAANMDSTEPKRRE